MKEKAINSLSANVEEAERMKAERMSKHGPFCSCELCVPPAPGPGVWPTCEVSREELFKRMYPPARMHERDFDIIANDLIEGEPTYGTVQRFVAEARSAREEARYRHEDALRETKLRAKRDAEIERLKGLLREAIDFHERMQDCAASPCGWCDAAKEALR